MAAILSAHIHLQPDVPVSYLPSSPYDFVTVQIGETLNKVSVVIRDVADLDRLAAVIAEARADLVAAQDKAVA